ncbi:MAG: chitooligosaccharide deacetylase, partial [Armatimonadetes bacterium CG17_big_fil_post_rev_8_21_14_2_50_66_6]
MPLLTRRAAELAKAGRLNLVRHGDSKRKEIALTFDDGPHPDY